VPREIVIVISDLYLPAPDAGGSSTAEAPSVPPGLGHLARFGHKEPIEEGWRVWLARWLGRADLASAAPASIAAVGLGPARGTAWFATPVHLIASLTSLHLDRRSVLRLATDDLDALADDFHRAFADSGFLLTPTEFGVFLMSGPGTLRAATTEPARAVIRELEASLPTGPSASVLKRLGAELEMWLHNHPINEARARRGELPVSTLWLWGGGDALETPTPQGSARSSSEAGMSQVTSLPPARSPEATRPPVCADLALGSDPYLTGLCQLLGAEHRPLPDSLPDLSGHPQPQRIAVVTEVTPFLRANPQWTVFNALADLDRRFVEPALSELHGGTVSSVALIANDTVLRIQRHDRRKFWRRGSRSVIGALRSR
jgi:hypothetical protein